MLARPPSILVHGCLAALLLGATACQQMAEPGNPLKSAGPSVAATPGTAAAATAPDQAFPPADQPQMVLTSEELAENAKKSRTKRAQAIAAAENATTPAPPVGVPAVSEPQVAAPTAVDAGVDAPAAPAATAATKPAPAGPVEIVAAKASTWPVRLVSSMPDTQPPRAILGLPDGREVVVTAGSMIPDQGIVVMAIGAKRVQLARIAAVGDHAVINEESIAAQY